MSDKDSDTSSPVTFEPRTKPHRRTSSNNNRSQGDALLKDFIVVGDYPKPTDDSPHMHRGIPAVRANSPRSFAQVVAGIRVSGEEIHQEDLDEYDFVTTLEKVKNLRDSENGAVQFPSCENGKPLERSWWGWFTRR